MARGFTVFALFMSLLLAFERFEGIEEADSSPEQATYRSLDGGGGPPPTPPPCLAEKCD